MRARDMRTDFAMPMGLLFLLIVGGGPWSVDAVRSTSHDVRRERA